MSAMHRFSILAGGLLLLAGTLAGCTPHTTGATEVGVKFNKITSSVEVMQPGANYFFMPVVNDWKRYDISLRNLVMTAQTDSGDRQGKDDLRFKTRDGNDIETDVTVRWRIDPSKAADIWRSVAPTTESLKLLRATTTSSENMSCSP